MKRFTETTKWRDPWFRRLSPPAKLLWQYLTDNCSNIGLVELDLDAAKFDIGIAINEKHLTELSDRVQALGNGKYFIPKFIPFQYGVITSNCPAHKPIIKAIDQHQLIHTEIGYQYPSDRVSNTLQDKKGKEKETDKERKEGVQGEIYHKDSRTALHWLNEKSGRHFRETSESLGFISERLSEPGVDIEGVKKMIDRQCARWKGTDQAEYLRPQTLFNKTKFDSYYAAKDLPYAAHQQPNQRNIGICKPSTGGDYGEAAKRKLERQALEAQHRAASEAQGNGTASGPVLHGDVGATADGQAAGSGGQ